MAYGKAIELFLVNGTADSLITAELSNWNGKALKLPRIEVASCNREDFRQPGVYFLFCKDDDDADSVYIGEAENVKERLVQHMRDYQAEKEKYYWNTAVVFIGRDLNKAHIRYLEDKLVKLARTGKRYRVLTKNTYSNTMLKESQIATMEEFLDNIKILISALGYKVLEPVHPKKVVADAPSTATMGSTDDDLLYLSAGSANAVGTVTSEGFVVLKGAVINEKTNTSLSEASGKKRDELIAEGKIKGLTAVEDLLFSSASAAATVILGYSVSGPKCWKDKDGRSLRDIEREATPE